MNSWTWFVAGAILLASELVLPTGFYLFLFGIAAFLVGIVTSTGILPGWEIQVGVFAVFAVVFSFVFASKLRSKLLGKAKPGSNDTIGKIVTISDLIQPGAIGAGELWGSPWRVKNVDSRPVAAKSECIVVHAEGVTLHVRNRD